MSHSIARKLHPKTLGKIPSVLIVLHSMASYSRRLYTHTIIHMCILYPVLNKTSHVQTALEEGKTQKTNIIWNCCMFTAQKHSAVPARFVHILFVRRFLGKCHRLQWRKKKQSPRRCAQRCAPDRLRFQCSPPSKPPKSMFCGYMCFLLLSWAGIYTCSIIMFNKQHLFNYLQDVVDASHPG